MLNRFNQLNFLTFRRIEMKIQDLSKELDTKTMSAVRGGSNYGNSASNIIGQDSKAYVTVTVGAAGQANTFVDVNSTQDASICNEQFGGDSFLALLPTLAR